VGIKHVAPVADDWKAVVLGWNGMG